MGRGSGVGFWNLSAGVGSGCRIKGSLTFNISSRGQAAVEFKELIHGVDIKSKNITMGSNLLWTRLSFMLFLSILAHTMARPNPWFGKINTTGFEENKEGKDVVTNIDIKRPNSRMIYESEVASTSSRFWDDLAPIVPRHLVQAFSGALRLCDILRFAEETFASLLSPFSAASRIDQSQKNMDPGHLLMEHRGIKTKI